MGNIITIGSATEDISFYLHEGILVNNKKDILRQKLLGFEYGAKIEVGKLFSSFGGGAANAAVNFSRLGFKVSICASLGDDSRGEAILRNLRSQGVNTKMVKKIKGGASPFSIVFISRSKEKITFTVRGAASFLKLNKQDLNNLKKARWIYLTSLSGNWEPVLKKIFSLRSPKIAWNPGHLQLKAGIRKIGKFLNNTSVLFVNKDEALELAVTYQGLKGKSRQFLNNTKNLLKILKDSGPEIVVITRGKMGADAYDGKEFFHQNILKEKRRADATGVGDAFNSSFIAGLEAYGNNIKKSMFLGAKNSASVISLPGAQNGLLTKGQAF